SQKLYRPETGKADAYANLQLILSRPIDWDLVHQQYDQMIKYTTALRLGTAETEAILRRFTEQNLQHPTYKAFAELGKAIKTIFRRTTAVNLLRIIRRASSAFSGSRVPSPSS